MSQVREIKEGRQYQGVDEEIIYTLTVPATWGTPTGTPTITGYSVGASGNTNVTATIFPAGSASVVGQVITLPVCKAMSAGVVYRVDVQFDTSEGGVMEAYALVEGEL